MGPSPKGAVPLQGLYRIDFEGDELSFATGTKLAKAVKSLRKGPVACLPGEGEPFTVSAARTAVVQKSSAVSRPPIS